MLDKNRALAIHFDTPLTSCPICTSSSIFFWKNKVWDTLNFSIFKCYHCNGGFLNPRPTDKTLDHIYQFSGHGLSKEVTCNDILEHENEFPNSSVDAERMISISEGLLFSSTSNGRDKKKNKMMDIGSGFGFFSLCGARHGFDVISINPGRYENRVCEELFSKNGLHANLRVGMFDDFHFEKETFSIVIASQIMEHIKKPRDLIIKIEELLTPGGVLALAVPNFHSIFVKLLATHENSCLWVPEHCNYFTERALLSLVANTRLKIAKTIQIAKIPYTAISTRLSLRRGTLLRKMSNLFVQSGQYLPCRMIEWIGTGNYLNVFFIKE